MKLTVTQQIRRVVTIDVTAEEYALIRAKRVESPTGIALNDTELLAAADAALAAVQARARAAMQAGGTVTTELSFKVTNGAAEDGQPVIG
jgi:hypothetical protein